jgi:DNA repair protein RadD
MKYVLREYQKEAAASGIETFKKKSKDILVLPTGAGKSLVIASIASQLEGNTIIFQPSKEILLQNYQKMIDFGVTDIGIFSASMKEKTVGKITFATIGTIHNKPEMWGNFKNVIIDECHLVGEGGMYDRFIAAHGGSVLGLTATPYRLHTFNDMYTGQQSAVVKFLTRTRPRIFTKITHITQVGDLYKQGFLCPIQYTINPRYNQFEINLNSTGADFNDESLKQYNKKMKLVDVVADSIQKSGRKHVLVFTRFVEDAVSLKNALQGMGISSGVVSAETLPKERQELLQAFRDGKIKVVSNVGVLTVGFDFPELDCVVLARPTQSVSLYYQMCGRGVRIAQGKLFTEIIDICGNVKKFGKIESFEIVKNSTNGLNRLKSDAGYLTGWDFVSNADVEETASPSEPQSLSGGVITFGKFGKVSGGKGTPIQQIPEAYARWVVGTFKDGAIKEMFQKELERRLLSR